MVMMVMIFLSTQITRIVMIRYDFFTARNWFEVTVLFINKDDSAGLLMLRF
jgi:hypothetical protein